MSMPRNVSVTCPKCGETFQARIFATVNTDFSPTIQEDIISGKLFDAPCPHCGFVAHLEYDVLYNDMIHSYWIWVVHDDEQFENDTKQVDMIPVPHSRRVRTIGELRDKVAIISSGYDDRIIELYKLYMTAQLSSQYPDFTVEQAVFVCQNGEELISLFNEKGESMSSKFRP